jgi:hypothetical protein
VNIREISGEHQGNIRKTSAQLQEEVPLKSSIIDKARELVNPFNDAPAKLHIRFHLYKITGGLSSAIRRKKGLKIQDLPTSNF